MSKKKNQKVNNQIQIDFNANSMTLEQFRTIRTNIQNYRTGEEVKTIIVTSPDKGDGKTTIAANLAALFTEEGKNVLLVDANFRHPTLHVLFNLTNDIGLTSVLQSKKSTKEVIQNSSIENLSVLTSGPDLSNPIKLLSSIEMEILMKELTEQFDMVILDTPSVLAVADVQILYKYSDGIILTVLSGKTKLDEAEKAKKILLSMSNKLPDVHTKILGVILNGTKGKINLY